MSTEVGVGIIVGAVAGSSLYIWNSNDFTQSQKIFLLICIIFPPAQWILAFIIYFYNKSGTYMKSISISSSTNKNYEQNEIKKSTIEEQKMSLEILKNRGVLSENEYYEKRNIIEKKVDDENIRNSSEYLNLNKLFENGILTKDEFDDKIKLIKQNYKNDEHLNVIDLEINAHILFNNWTNGNILFKIFDDYSFEYYYTLKKTITPIRGYWSIVDSHHIMLKMDKRNEMFRFISINENQICYKHNSTIFRLDKVK